MPTACLPKHWEDSPHPGSLQRRSRSTSGCPFPMSTIRCSSHRNCCPRRSSLRRHASSPGLGRGVLMVEVQRWCGCGCKVRESPQIRAALDWGRFEQGLRRAATDADTNQPHQVIARAHVRRNADFSACVRISSARHGRPKFYVALSVCSRLGNRSSSRGRRVSRSSSLWLDPAMNGR